MFTRIGTCVRVAERSGGRANGNMQLTNVQGLQIAPLMSFPHGNCKLPAREVLEGWLFVTKEGCSWRALAEPYGP